MPPQPPNEIPQPLLRKGYFDSQPRHFHPDTRPVEFLKPCRRVTTSPPRGRDTKKLYWIDANAWDARERAAVMASRRGLSSSLRVMEIPVRMPQTRTRHDHAKS